MHRVNLQPQRAALRQRLLAHQKGWTCRAAGESYGRLWLGNIYIMNAFAWMTKHERRILGQYFVAWRENLRNVKSSFTLLTKFNVCEMEMSDQ